MRSGEDSNVYTVSTERLDTTGKNLEEQDSVQPVVSGRLVGS